MIGGALAAAIAADATTSALVLAVVQGLTEFLPISSDGHLVIFQTLLGHTEFGLTFTVALHLGTLAAVVWAYRKDLVRLILDCLAGRFALLGWLFVANLPAGIVGILFHDWIEAHQSSRVAGAGLLGTALLLAAGERARRMRGEPVAELAPLRLRDALLMGCAQALAILPGVSRSGSTIAVGLMCGLRSVHAARLSFLMSIPAVAGACALELPAAVEHGFQGLSMGTAAVDVLVSALVCCGALRFLLLTVARGAFRWFALYCTLVGVTVLLFL